MANGILSISRTGSTPSYVSFSTLWASTPDATTNTSTLTIQIVAQNTSSQYYVSGSTCTTGVTVRANNGAGEQKSQTVTLSISPNSSQTIYSQTFTIHHDAEGNASITMSASVSGGITGTGAGTATLDQIQRGATAIVSLASKTETGATINWATDAAIDYFWYKVNSGSWVANGSVSGTSGAFTLTGLTHNTSYTVTIKVRKASNQVQTESEALAFTTYSYPYATNMPNFNIGSTLSVGIYNPLGRTVSVKLQDANGNQMGSQSTSGTTASGYAGATVQTALYGSIPNAKSGTYKIAVTYGGHTETRTGGKYYTVEADCKPELNTPTYMDTQAIVTAVTGDDQIIVQYKSTPKVTATGCAAKKSATIASVKAVVPGQTKTLTVSGTTAEGTLNATTSAVDMTCTVTITDSRGYTASKTVTMTVSAYYYPSIAATVHRHNNYYTDTDVTASVDFPAIGSNAVTISYSATGSGGSVSGTLTNNTLTTIQLDNRYDWTLTVAAVDSFGSLSSIAVFVQKGTPLIFFDKDKYSVGINCFPAQDSTLEIDGAVMNRNVMTAEASTTTSGTTTQKLTLSASETVGDQLSIDSGGVKIGPKLSKVLVSAQVSALLSSTADLHTIEVRKGTTNVASAYIYQTASTSNTVQIIPVLLSVAANDTINLYVSGYASTELLKAILTVEAMA